MNDKKIAIESAVEQLEMQIEGFMEGICFDDVIRMQFLEQSAKYLGVYVENNSIDLLDHKVIN